MTFGVKLTNDAGSVLFLQDIEGFKVFWEEFPIDIEWDDNDDVSLGQLTSCFYLPSGKEVVWAQESHVPEHESEIAINRLTQALLRGEHYISANHDQ